MTGRHSGEFSSDDRAGDSSYAFANQRMPKITGNSRNWNYYIQLPTSFLKMKCTTEISIGKVKHIK
jgi:hypothetical protein